MPLAQTLAALHASAFTGAARWSPPAFQAAIEDRSCFLLLDGPDADPGGFALGRTVADEAELLTLVVAKPARRQGKGVRLLARFEDAARSRTAQAAFLEVAADNMPARSLYGRCGWSEAGRRSGYYDGVDALVLRKDL